jgi:hypothetical protein
LIDEEVVASMLKYICLSFFITWKALMKASRIARGESAGFRPGWETLVKDDDASVMLKNLNSSQPLKPYVCVVLWWVKGARRRIQSPFKFIFKVP